MMQKQKDSSPISNRLSPRTKIALGLLTLAAWLLMLAYFGDFERASPPWWLVYPVRLVGFVAFFGLLILGAKLISGGLKSSQERRPEMEPQAMSTIEEEGFLCDQISHWVAEIRNQNQEWFELCENINRFSHQTMLTVKIHNKVLIELIASTLYVRAMSNFQATILTSERGMINEAKALSRCLLECVFAIVAIEKDEDFAGAFGADDLRQRKGYIEAYRRIRGKDIITKDAPSIQQIDRLKRSLEKNIKDKDIKPLTKRDIAVKARLESMYDTAYKVLSGTVHINVRDLEQYLDISEADDVQTILWGPDARDIDFILFTAAESMLFVLTALSKIFSLSYPDIWTSILKMYKTLGNRFDTQL